MAMKQVSSTWSMPNTCATFGWFSDASVLASRSNRRSRSSSSASSSGSTLMATSRSSRVSLAR